MKPRFTSRYGDLVTIPDQEYFVAVMADMTVEHVDVQDGWFYAFLDEFGDESLPVKGLDIFALGGCCFIGKDKQKSFCRDWAELRREVFRLPESIGYHSKNHLRKVKESGIAKIVDFIKRNSEVKYVSSVCSKDAPISTSSEEKYSAVIRSATRTLSDSASSLFNVQVPRDEWYFEHSIRMTPRMIMESDGPSYLHSAQNGGIYFLKNSHDAAIELADLVNHVVGKHITYSFRKKHSFYESIFNAMFGDPTQGQIMQTLALMHGIHVSGG